jgi:hypothetical protein
VQQSTFVERRSAAWDRLEELVRRAGRQGVRALDAAGVAELGRLYRGTTSDLAFARGRGYDGALLEYLNRLTARAHAFVYGGTTESGWQRVGHYYAQTFPREFRRSFALIAICAALTVVASIVAYSAVTVHPAQAYALLPKEMIPDQIRKS